MRLITYNIRYGTGTKWYFHLPFPFSGYLRRTQQNLHKIAEFLRPYAPDIIGLIEVDFGSLCSGNVHQSALLAEDLGHYHVYESKYASDSVMKKLPIARKQGNAFLTSERIVTHDFHYFEQGVKRLVIELELEKCIIFLVHLSLHYRHRQNQLHQLYELFKAAKKPYIVTGDFNVLWGDNELDLFFAATGLRNANVQNEKTFPSSNPTRQLDFILYSDGISIDNVAIPHVTLSDHLPIVCDFSIL